MTDGIPLYPAPAVPEWMEEQAAEYARVRGEREAWTGRTSDRGFTSLADALTSLVELDWRPPTRKPRSNREKRAYADHLREHMTPAETVLWSWLQELGLDFAPQQVVGGWIVDFYSPSLRLVVEVDGSVHAPVYRVAQDRERDASLVEKGHRVIRLTNHEVRQGWYGPLLREIGASDA